jgi:hypothetical protein
MIRRYEDQPPAPDDLPPLAATRPWPPHPAQEVEQAKVALLQVGRSAAPRRRRSFIQRHPIATAAAAVALTVLVRRSPLLKAAVGAAIAFAARTAIQRGAIRLLQRTRF